MDKIKQYLMDMDVEHLNTAWTEGFLTGLHFAGMVTDEQLDQLETWIKGGWYKEA